MRLWNMSKEDIRHLYNNQNVIIKAGQVITLADEMAIFLLNRKDIVGMGLVQLKDDDKKEMRYKEARLNQFKWATEKWADYEKHCEEREAQKLQPLKPHPAIAKYKIVIDEYNKWVDEGELIPDGIVEPPEKEKVVCICPYCQKTFDTTNSLKGHLMSHKEENVNKGSSEDKD